MIEAQLNMRIAMRSPHRYKITEHSINNVPNISTFIEPEINEAITQGCKEVLRHSLNSKTHQHGECVLLISTLETDIHGNKLDNVHEIAYGNHRKVQLTDKMNYILDNRNVKDLILIHNHPSNGSFSYSDLKVLSRGRSLLGVVAVGNTSNVYIALNIQIGNKITKFVEQQYSKYTVTRNIGNINESALKDKIVSKYVITNPDKFSIVYEKYNRRSI